jgi:hypothetical protein
MHLEYQIGGDALVIVDARPLANAVAQTVLLRTQHQMSTSLDHFVPSSHNLHAHIMSCIFNLPSIHILGNGLWI